MQIHPVGAAIIHADRWTDGPTKAKAFIPFQSKNLSYGGPIPPGKIEQ